MVYNGILCTKDGENNGMNIDLTKVQKYLEWMKTKLYLDTISQSTKGKDVKRGEVYWCHFGINIGSEMSKETERPCVIVQNDIANIKSPNTIVIPITHDTGKLPCLVAINTLYNADGTIKLDGNVNTSNIICISKARLINKIDVLTPLEIKNIDISIAKQIDLMSYYSKINKQLISKDQYILQLKNQRNKAQDTIRDIKMKLNANSDEDIMKKIEDIIDKQIL